MMLNLFKKRLLPAVVILLVLLLTGCGILGSDPTETETVPPTEAAFTVRFVVKGENVTGVEVSQGQCPVMPEVTLPGLIITGWLDAENRPVDPATTPIFADTVYHAVAYPILSNHVPFLFPDEAGALRPEEPLTARELSDAIRAVAVKEALPYLPEIPENTALTEDALWELLRVCFPATAVSDALRDLPEGVISRGNFARIMVDLLERDGETVQTLEPLSEIPTELGFGQDYVLAMLEAAIPHFQDSEGVTWETTFADLRWEPGHFNRNGWLYYADENGVLVHDTQIGLLSYGSDGRYTCGDAELDGIVAGILDEIIEANPDAERIDLLRRAFEYCRDSFTYLRKAPYAFGATGWEVEDAKDMFTKLRGNCYNFASTFWALARGLGYDAWSVSGTMTKTYQPHGWVEIEFDGAFYVFDVEMEYVYVHERDRHDMDMFMVNYTKGEYWTYRRPAKQ